MWPLWVSVAVALLWSPHFCPTLFHPLANAYCQWVLLGCAFTLCPWPNWGYYLESDLIKMWVQQANFLSDFCHLQPSLFMAPINDEDTDPTLCSSCNDTDPSMQFFACCCPQPDDDVTSELGEHDDFQADSPAFRILSLRMMVNHREPRHTTSSHFPKWFFKGRSCCTRLLLISIYIVRWVHFLHQICHF